MNISRHSCTCSGCRTTSLSLTVNIKPPTYYGALAPHVSSHHNVCVYADPPVFWSLSVDPEEVINGSVVMMSCVMDGFPEPSVTWLHSGMNVWE